MRQKTWNLKKLPEAVKNSVCWSDVCRYLGRPPGGSSHATVVRWVKKLKLDHSHFDPKIGGRRAGKTLELPIEKLFTSNSVCPRGQVRRRILRENLIDYKCEQCDNAGEWRGVKLSLQLEHKNGINNDHRLENLCWLCPNCHAQTPTFAGRNKIKVVM